MTSNSISHQEKNFWNVVKIFQKNFESIEAFYHDFFKTNILTELNSQAVDKNLCS